MGGIGVGGIGVSDQECAAGVVAGAGTGVSGSRRERVLARAGADGSGYWREREPTGAGIGESGSRRERVLARAGVEGSGYWRERESKGAGIGESGSRRERVWGGQRLELVSVGAGIWLSAGAGISAA